MKGGISSYFTSRGMFLNRSRKRDRSFKHYFEIQGFVEVEAAHFSRGNQEVARQKGDGRIVSAIQGVQEE